MPGRKHEGGAGKFPISSDKCLRFTKYHIEARHEWALHSLRDIYMKSLLASCLADSEGQDVLEYALLLAFVVVCVATLVLGMGKNVQTITSVSNAQLVAADAATH